MAFPRILIFSHEFPQTGTAGGLILQRLFQEYPPELVRILGPEPDANSKPVAFQHHVIQMPWKRFEGSRYNKVHRTLRTFRLVPCFSVRQADQLLEGFRPNVVLTVMQHGTWYDSAMAYAKAKKIPLVTIVHDANENFDKVFDWAKKAQTRADSRFYRHARHRLCVSTEMEEFCFRKYGVRGEVMYPNRDESLRPRPLEWNLELRNPPYLTVGFVGNVNYGYGEALVELLPTFKQTGSRLRIWGPSPGQECRALAKSESVSLEGFLPAPEVWEPVKSKCDAVILPYSSSKRMKQLYSYHFPSKLTEYLALGMPVIITGPEYAAGVRWAKRNLEAVITENKEKPDNIGLLLEKLKKDVEIRVRKAKGAAKIGSQQFEPAKIRKRLMEIFSSL